MKTEYKGRIDPTYGKEIILFDNKFLQYVVYMDGKVVNSLTGREMKTHQDNNSYLYVTLTHQGKTKKIRVHTLVFRTFVHNNYDPRKFVVDHKDCNKHNNFLDNFRLISYSNNTKSYYQNREKCAEFRKKNAAKLDKDTDPHLKIIEESVEPY